MSLPPLSNCLSRVKANKQRTVRSPQVKRLPRRSQLMQNLNSCGSGSKRSKLPRQMNLLPEAAISSVSRKCSARCRSTTPISSSGDQTTRTENLLRSPSQLSNKLFAFVTKAQDTLIKPPRQPRPKSSADSSGPTSSTTCVSTSPAVPPASGFYA